jgi:CHASE2 domain-containing sensor protein
MLRSCLPRWFGRLVGKSPSHSRDGAARSFAPAAATTATLIKRVVRTLLKVYLAGAWLTAATTCSTYVAFHSRGWFDVVAAVLVVTVAAAIATPLNYAVNFVTR